MNKTCLDIIVEVLRTKGGIATLSEIYEGVQKEWGIKWNTLIDPKGQIRNCLQSHCPESVKKHNRGENLFYFARGKFNGVYGLLEYRMIDEPIFYKKEKEADDKDNKISPKGILEEVRVEGKKKRINKRLSEGQAKLDDKGRNITLVNNLKKHHLNICQICGDRIEDEFGTTSEAHHIKHFSKNGDDTIDNMIILCPNCHAKIHRFSIPSEKLRIVQKYSTHYISDKNLEWYEKQRELKISKSTEENKLK